MPTEVTSRPLLIPPIGKGVQGWMSYRREESLQVEKDAALSKYHRERVSAGAGKA